jgi:transposase
MEAPRKYPDELRERATRLAVEARRDPQAGPGAIRRIAGQLGVHPEALRTWVKRAEADEGVREGTSSGDGARIAELERESCAQGRATGAAGGAAGQRRRTA